MTLRVPQARLFQYIDDAAKLPNLNLVVISGGEPFLLGRDLSELISACADHGKMTRIVTNGYWAVDEARARERLRPLLEAGLNEINFSTGDDHVEFVPLGRIMLGLDAALEFGLGVSLMIEQTANSNLTYASIQDAASEWPRIKKALRTRKLHLAISPWMPFGDPDHFPEQPKTRLVNSENLHERTGCPSILSTIVVTPDEQVGICCGLPREYIPDLNVGNLRDSSLPDLVEQGLSDFIKIWLHVEGPEHILAWAAEKDPSIEWENIYAHQCDACRAMYQNPRLMNVVANHYQEKLLDVLQAYSIQISNPRRTASAGMTSTPFDDTTFQAQARLS